jgi:hypothetical protein
MESQEQDQIATFPYMSTGTYPTQTQRAAASALTNFLSMPSDDHVVEPEPPAFATGKGRRQGGGRGGSNDDDSQTSTSSKLSEEPQFPSGPVVPPTKEDIQQLSEAIKSWHTTFEKITAARQVIKEESKRQKTLESLIVNMMKNHAIGALDLKASGGRILYKKQKRTNAVPKKDMLPLLAEHLGDEKKAREALEFLEKHKTSEWKEGLRYEKLED